ncbi:MAG: hypothetical protein GXO87_08340 [Chlorobi bacterium]|nr:hypothetical protein [Chlorobiota bacterium]
MDYSEDAEKFFLNEQNKKKKKELKEKYDADFYKADDALPLEIENRFLDSVMSFEEEWENAEEIEIYEYLDKPKFENIENIIEVDLPFEIDRVLDIYHRKNINIDVIEEEDVTEKDFYKFLTEELPKQKFYPITGMTTNYIYEEFHPSDKLDSKDAIEDVLYGFLNNYEYKDLYISKEKTLNVNGKEVERKEFIKGLSALFEDVEKAIERKIEFKKFNFEDKNEVEADLILRYKTKDGSKEIDKIFKFVFELIHSEYGGMTITGYELKML